MRTATQFHGAPGVRIPLWINVLQVVILGILTFQTIACYANPQWVYPGITVDGASAKSLYVLAGRNAVMATISLVALVLQNPRFYSFAFLMHSLRELQDMFIVPLTSEPGGGAVGTFFVFLLVFVIPELVALVKLHRMAAYLEHRSAKPAGAEEAEE